jgi:hypothetical protein
MSCVTLYARDDQGQMGPRLHRRHPSGSRQHTRRLALTVPLPHLHREPLLRWLHVGGRGYMHGCLAQKTMDERLKHAVSGAAYADDVGILTNTLSDLQVQAHKLSSYSDWGAMQVNVGKTIVSGVSHKHTRAWRHNTKSAYNQVARQLTGRIKVQGQPVTYQDPREPFTYRGGADHDTRLAPAAACNRREAPRKLECLRGSCATPTQVRIWCAAASSPPSRTHSGSRHARAQTSR